MRESAGAKVHFGEGRFPARERARILVALEGRVRFYIPMISPSRLILFATFLISNPLRAAESDPAPEAAEPAAARPVESLEAFGSGEPPARAEIPERGQIVVEREAKMEAMEHWDQYDWKIETPRWGRYEVFLTYGLKMNSLGVQLKMGEERLKARLAGALFEEPKTVSLGGLYFPTAGEHAVSIYTPPVQKLKGISFQGLRLIPAPEGDRIVQNEDGSILLEAKDATTWSTKMRYEPKPEKNCLGFWTEVEDWADWEFTVEKGGKFAVVVFQGCGGKNGGSEVEVILGDQILPFKVIDTEGFQDFKPVSVGELEIAEAGHYRLAVKPKTKAKGAIMDIQKIVLTPVE